MKQQKHNARRIKLDSKLTKPGYRLGFSVQRSTVLALLTFIIGLTPAAQAQVNNSSPAIDEKQEIKLKLEDVDIRVLINTVAEVTGKNFIVDPRVKGKVAMISGKSVSPEELYDYFLAILEVHNFAAVETGSIIKILPANVIKQKPTPTLFSPTQNVNDQQVTQIIQLQHASVQDLSAILRPLIPPTGHFAPHTPSNSVVITDTAANIQRVMKIIRRIDVSDKRSNTHVVYLNKAKASDLATALTQLVAATADPTKAGGVGAKLNIQPFDSINALVISATDEQFVRIGALIEELDIERELAGDVNVIPLKYARAEDLVPILNDLTVQEQGAITEFKVQADEASNSLVVKASSGQLKTVQSVVEKLDKRRAQVFVETIIAEVSLNQQANLGITWNAGVPAPTSTTGEGDSAITETLARNNTVFNRAGTGTSRTVFPNQGTTGFNYNLLDFGRYQLDVVLNALRSDSNSNVLSTPTILTLDNEEAEIVVGQEVPFVTGRFNNGQNVDTNDNNLSVGTGFQTIERKDVGLKLKIKPLINEGDTIQLEVLQEISSVVEEAIEGQSDLITNRRSIEATVQVDDGQVVVLGGLISDDSTDNVEWVPFLGKLPLIGALFRNKRKIARKRNLMVFLKPRIIRTPEDLEKFSKVKYEDVQFDGKVYRGKNKSFLISDSEPAVLKDYDDTTGEGLIRTQQRERLIQEGYKEERNIVKDIIFGRDDSHQEQQEHNDHPDGEVPVGDDDMDENAAQTVSDEIEAEDQ